MIFRLCAAALLTALFCVARPAAAQELFFTSNGHIDIFSSAPLEDISAENKNVSSVLNVETGKMMFKVPMDKFDFPNDLMEEHYNEKYVESEKFPFAEFSGQIQDFANIDLTKNGAYKVVVKGDLTLHGVTRKVSENGSITVKDGKILSSSAMKIRLADYDIEIPTVVVKKIAEVIDVKIDMEYKPYKK